MTDLKIIRGRTPGAWKVLIYGTPGAGKSTLATHAPKPFFLDFENGLRYIDCDRSDRITSYNQIKPWVETALAEGYKSIIFDTLDALEELLTKKVCETHGKPTLNDFGYGKGFDLLVNEWLRILDVANWLQDKGINVLFVGHEKIEKFEDPSSENYDRFLVKIHKKSAATVTARMDAVLFCRIESVIKDKNDGRGVRAVGTGKRVIHTVEAPCWVAKNRFSLPATIPMSPNLFKLISAPAKAEEDSSVLQPPERREETQVRNPPEGNVSSAGI